MDTGKPAVRVANEHPIGFAGQRILRHPTQMADDAGISRIAQQVFQRTGSARQPCWGGRGIQLQCSRELAADGKQFFFSIPLAVNLPKPQ